MEMCCTKAGELSAAAHGQLSKRIAGQKYNLVTKRVWPKEFFKKKSTLSIDTRREREREEMPTSSYNYDGISILQGAL